MDTCHDVLDECTRRRSRVCVTPKQKFFRKACPSLSISESSGAPLTLWSGIRPAGAGNQRTSGLASGRSVTSRSTAASTARSVDGPASSKGAPLLLPIPRKDTCESSSGTPMARGKAGMTPAHTNAGTTPGVKRTIFRKGTRGTPLARDLLGASAGMTPMFTKKNSMDSIDESIYQSGVQTPSDAVTKAKALKEFVKRMLKGANMQAMIPGGSMKNVWVVLDKKLSALTVTVDAHQRRIPLDQIDDISIGQDAQGELSLRIDEHCVTLLLQDGQGVAFYFEDTDERDTFAECLSMVMVQ